MYDTITIYVKNGLCQLFFTKNSKILRSAGNLNLELPFKIHIVLDGIGVFVEVKAENALVGPCDGCGVFENIAGFKVRNPLDSVSGHPSPAFQLFFIVPADDDRFDGFHCVE
jgi:hypothetical protein